MMDNSQVKHQIGLQHKPPVGMQLVIKKSGQNFEKKNKLVILYFQWAVGDLGCLFEADIGIVFGSSLSLR